MSLQNWLENSWLEKHSTSRAEIQAFFAKADQALADSRIPGLSDPGRYHHCYTSALAVAIACLAASGYRTERRDSHHYRAFQSLEFTLGLQTKELKALDGLRKKRNLSMYDAAGSVGPEEAGEMSSMAEMLRAKAEEWFRSQHPELW